MHNKVQNHALKLSGLSRFNVQVFGGGLGHAICAAKGFNQGPAIKGCPKDKRDTLKLICNGDKAATVHAIDANQVVDLLGMSNLQTFFKQPYLMKEVSPMECNKVLSKSSDISWAEPIKCPGFWGGMAHAVCAVKGFDKGAGIKGCPKDKKDTLKLVCNGDKTSTVHALDAGQVVELLGEPSTKNFFIQPRLMQRD